MYYGTPFFLADAGRGFSAPDWGSIFIGGTHVTQRVGTILLRPGAMLLLAACLLLAGAVGRAGEDADVYSQLMRRYETLNDELLKAINDYEGNEPLPDIPERVLSIRKNAVVTVGGEVRLTHSVSKAEWSDPGFDSTLPNNGKSESHRGILGLSAAKLLIDARLHERWRAYFDASMTGDSGRHSRKKFENVNTPGSTVANPYAERDTHQTIQQAYIEFMKDGHSGFGFLAGLMKLPFGLWDRPNLFAQSYMDAPDLNASYLMGSMGWSNAQLLPHASRFIDPAVAVMINYEMRDIIRFDAAIFRENDSGLHSYVKNGTYREEADSGLPRSWQVGMSIQPLEGWELTAHFRNRHSQSRGISKWADTPTRWDFRQNLASGGNDPRWDASLAQWSDTGTGESFGSTANEQAVIVGLAAEIPNTNLAVRAEYAYGWNQGFNEHISSESVNVGLSYRMLPRLTLHAQGEWLHVRDRSWLVADGGGNWGRDRRDSNLYRVMLGAEYEFSKGLTVEAGWQYEYWKIRSALGGDGGGPERRVNKAHMFYMGTRFIF